MSRASTHIFRIRFEPRIYRDIEIESGKSLYNLAAAITDAFGFELDHAFGFYSALGDHIFDSAVRYELFADLKGLNEGPGVKRTKVIQAFPEIGSKMQFMFDYGDDWRFEVEVIGRGEKTPGTRYPKVVRAVGKAPPQYAPAEEGW
ncbi:MAG: hypothetical protein JO110_07485 [Acetobacteraceae bacterium]|nr:hypothetical protein [Acetobacteraceae bacterium]